MLLLCSIRASISEMEQRPRAMNRITNKKDLPLNEPMSCTSPSQMISANLLPYLSPPVRLTNPHSLSTANPVPPITLRRPTAPILPHRRDPYTAAPSILKQPHLRLPELVVRVRS
ncbi:hypothetical protein HYC85_000453 [Camellia sinensis]|uniref:Uncharacterized protein n=1 Tax=Camellia sinensis TaxID=4442 RepID=A0A7J7I4D6_CAMSI|nr:hypothetical protein HYC85_000453 [Camellia sinensis]